MVRANRIGYWIEPGAYSAGIKFIVSSLEGCRIKKKHEGLERLKRESLESISYDPDDKLLAGYRTIFSRLGIEGAVASPEYLHQLVKRSGRLPQISTAVDAYNLISLKYNLVVSAHDVEKLEGPVRLVMVDEPEDFYPLGGPPETVPVGEWAVRDNRHLLCRMNCKQSEQSKLSLGSRDILLYIQGSLESDANYLDVAMDEAVALIQRFCGGELVKVSMLKEYQAARFDPHARCAAG